METSPDVFVFCTHCNVPCFPIKGVRSERLQQFLAFLEVCPQIVLRQCLHISHFRSVVHTGSSLEWLWVTSPTIFTKVHHQKKDTRSKDIWNAWKNLESAGCRSIPTSKIYKSPHPWDFFRNPPMVSTQVLVAVPANVLKDPNLVQNGWFRVDVLF